MNPNVPVTEDEIVADALSCFGVGAAIVSAYPLRRSRRSGRLNPSFSHGVTATVVGNCGLGFAPCRPGRS
ncbi:3-keto-5-aminohexanoate cleavage protein [Mycobacterium colombiense]|uniref:3-keto-5-aminohexanoate cleavage protein n=1 Tax=Mycobacterium colombiense TaxID=339268 RepID=UPI00093DA0B3